MCGAFLVALGALSLLEAARIRDDWPGARLMPAVIGVALVVVGLAHVTADFGSSSEAPPRRRAVVLFAALVLYVAALPWLGFLPTTGAFVLVVLRWLGAFSWTVTLALTAAIAIVTDLVFTRWLGMPLPPGLFG